MRRRPYVQMQAQSDPPDSSVYIGAGGDGTQRSVPISTTAFVTILFAFLVITVGVTLSLAWVTTHSHTEKKIVTVRSGFSYEEFAAEHIDFTHSHQAFQECWRDASDRVLCAPTPFGDDIKLSVVNGNGGCTHSDNVHVFLEVDGTDYPMLNTLYQSFGACSPALSLNTTYVCTQSTQVPSGVGSIGIKSQDSYGNVVSRSLFASVRVFNSTSPNAAVAALVCPE